MLTGTSKMRILIACLMEEGVFNLTTGQRCLKTSTSNFRLLIYPNRVIFNKVGKTVLLLRPVLNE